MLHILLTLPAITTVPSFDYASLYGVDAPSASYEPTLLPGATLAAVSLAPVAAAPTYAPVMQAAAEDEGGPWYFRINGGFVSTEDSDGPDEDIDFDEGYLVAAAIGQRMSSGPQAINFDLELEAVWTDQDVDENGPIQALSDVTVLGFLLNGILDFRLGERLSLYGGGGIGAAWLDAGTESDALNDFDEEDGPFLAWQAKAGLMWRFARSTSLQLGYRFLNVDDAEIDDDLGNASFELETQQSVLEAGLRFGF